MRLSYSKLSAFGRCPYLYRKIYIERARRVPKSFFSFGSSVHKALEKFYSGPLLYKLGLKKHTKEYLLKLLEKNWLTDGISPEQNRKLLDEARAVLSNYYDIFTDGIFSPAWGVEVPFSFRAGPHEVRGYIDRIQKNGRGFEIIDYKTNRRIPPAKQMREDLQLKIYFYALRNFFRKNADSVSYIFLRFGKKISFDTSSFDSGKIRDEILGIAGRITAEKNFYPKRNIYCGSCDFRSECGMFND